MCDGMIVVGIQPTERASFKSFEALRLLREQLEDHCLREDTERYGVPQ
jgi:hypothetical protein